MNDASSDASQQTIDAISSTVPKRFIGILDFMKAMNSLVICSKIGLSTAAGATAFTVTPAVASSLPSDFVRPITAALDEE